MKWANLVSSGARHLSVVKRVGSAPHDDNRETVILKTQFSEI